ncbi:GNAT family N-acetyltransferase [Paludicola sp. MB14-C6]|uniref:GNAT family N-acetyltransferase n=1 Tax=Paludihabitans sp. MB14-C6 TaxID=3070656 RepID=UPI0027DBEAEC|nr:GNAT family N-acetyltransferase [Paludicola sp. MB14-C6]WMJ22462.1 GNAT family N-acetyltransferase [Paludicola sp. MB14-C6]
MMKTVYETNRLKLVLADISIAKDLVLYYQRNKDFLRAFEPLREESFYTFDYQQKLLQNEMNQIKDDSSYRFYIYEKRDFNRIIGMIGLNNIVRGAFQSCFLGYKLDCEKQNIGYMTEAVLECTRIAFEELHLHRIEANVMPRNTPSLRVLEKCGYQNEGISKNYLNINGTWEDHIHMVCINQSY